MELKKTPKADLEGKRGLFLEVGLCLSLLAMIGTFAWGASKRQAGQMPTPPEDPIPVEMIDNTTQEQPMPQIPTPRLIRTTDPTEIVITNEPNQVQTSPIFIDPPELAGVTAGPSTGEILAPEGMTNDIFEDVKFMPQFQGGNLNTFAAWVRSRVRYPEFAQQMGVQGRVIVQFVVEKDGSLSNIEVASNTDRQLNAEALRVVRQSPRWTPGRQITLPVRVKMQIPVDFVLK